MDYVLASYYAWQGRPVTREGWPKGTYAVLKGASPHIFVPSAVPTVWHPTAEDRRAEDYSEVHTGLCRSNASSCKGASCDTDELDDRPDCA